MLDQHNTALQNSREGFLSKWAVPPEVQKKVIFELRQHKPISQTCLAPYLEYIQGHIDYSLATVLSFNKLPREEIDYLNYKIPKFFGELVKQNAEGDQVVYVYDRDPNQTMAKGARYHQTHEGGIMHTDNVNLPDPWELLILSCLQPSHEGGINFFVDGRLLYHHLKENHPKELGILKKDFFWEMRGVEDRIFKAPIVKTQKGKILYRHLRPYMESAHQKMSSPLTDEQTEAINCLDRALQNSNIRKSYQFERGDFLFALDSEIMHGRSEFKDLENCIDYPDSRGNNKPVKRTLGRIWIERKP